MSRIVKKKYEAIYPNSVFTHILVSHIRFGERKGQREERRKGETGVGICKKSKKAIAVQVEPRIKKKLPGLFSV